MVMFLLKTHKAKDSSCRSLTVISGRMLSEAIRGRPGGHIREQSTRSMLRYAVRTLLTLKIEQEDFPAEWIFPFLLQNTQGWQPSMVISGRMLSLAYSSETGWPHQRAVDQLV